MEPSTLVHATLIGLHNLTPDESYTLQEISEGAGLSEGDTFEALMNLYTSNKVETVFIGAFNPPSYKLSNT
jgi:hypothetical protein